MEPAPRTNLRVEQKNRTRRRLLDAAVTVFTDKPFAEARMEDIAGRAGVTRATVYAHFPGKADIVDALIEHVHDLRAKAYADLADLPQWTAADIRAWLEGAEARWREAAPIRRIAIASGPSRNLDDARARYVEAHERCVDLIVARGQRWQGVAPAEARQRALMVVLQTESFFSAWIASGCPVDTPDPLRLLADSLCHLLAPALDTATNET